MSEQLSDHSIPLKPLIGVSRCLLGDPVRYNGESRRSRWVADVLSLHCDFVPICPEVEAGLGVPRPALRLVGSPNQLRAVGVADAQLDVTDQLRSYFKQLEPRLQGVCGMILKARSPSCGVSDTPVFTPADERLEEGAGLFTRAVLQAFPGMPVIDETGLESESGRIGFLIQIFRRCYRQPLSPPSNKA